jgi:hypothetical protein
MWYCHSGSVLTAHYIVCMKGVCSITHGRQSWFCWFKEIEKLLRLGCLYRLKIQTKFYEIDELACKLLGRYANCWQGKPFNGVTVPVHRRRQAGLRSRSRIVPLCVKVFHSWRFCRGMARLLPIWYILLSSAILLQQWITICCDMRIQPLNNGTFTGHSREPAESIYHDIALPGMYWDICYSSSRYVLRYSLQLFQVCTEIFVTALPGMYWDICYSSSGYVLRYLLQLFRVCIEIFVTATAHWTRSWGND